MPKAVLFDLDGVLIDSFGCWFSAFNETLKKFGLDEIGEEKFSKRYWGQSTERSFEALGLGKDADEHCHRMQLKHIEKVNVPKGLRKTLKLIKSRVKVGLVTNTPRMNTEKILARFRLGGCFDAVVTGDDVVEKKPRPEMVLRACELLGVEPGGTILVGDTEADVGAGRSAGCVVVGMNVRADFTISELSELFPILKTLARKRNPAEDRVGALYR